MAAGVLSSWPTDRLFSSFLGLESTERELRLRSSESFSASASPELPWSSRGSGPNYRLNTSVLSSKSSTNCSLDCFSSKS